jgi:hypothetical protein
MIAARFLLIVSVLNLIFLIAEISLNIFKSAVS